MIWKNKTAELLVRRAVCCLASLVGIIDGMHTYEVEVKSLLGGEEQAEALRSRMKEIDPGAELVSRNKQLNHYFIGGDMRQLAGAVAPYLSADAQTKLADMIERGSNFSIRTREKDDDVFLVVKASTDGSTSANGTSRIELEEKINLSLDELDKLLLGAGFEYQAKWSREREEYVCDGTNVCLDRNAGYGWLAEFEKMVEDEMLLAQARKEIDMLMYRCGVCELSQDRLERMFAHYNAHWPEYYGTDKIFIIE